MTTTTRGGHGAARRRRAAHLLPALAVALVAGACSGAPRSAAPPASASAATASAPAAIPPPGSLEWIGEATLPIGMEVDGTPVGGLSGLVWSGADQSFYALSDDRGEHAPSRFYKLEVDLASGKLADGAVSFAGVIRLTDSRGLTYAKGAIDPEGFAIAPDGSFFWGSEGVAKQGIPPFVAAIDRDGRETARLPLRVRFIPDGHETKGVRDNLAFEDLSVTPDGAFLVGATENALVTDGPAADVDSASLSRVLVWRLGTSDLPHEFVYRVEPVTGHPANAKALRVNGLTDVLALDDERFLALEREYVAGAGFRLRLYLASLAAATEVSGMDDLSHQPAEPAAKELLVDFADLGIPLENFEGMALGPRLPDGRRSLLIVSDDNFDEPLERTRFLAFAWDDHAPSIAEIQGAGHRSPLEGRWVHGVEGRVTGIVTTGKNPAFFVESCAPDDDPATSEGVRVEGDVPKGTKAGDGVFVGGRVVEYAYAAKELSVTTLVASAVVPDPKAPPLPPPVRIGVGPAPSTPVESQDSAAPAAESVATATLAAQPSATGTPAAQPPAPATPAAPSASTAAPAVAPGATVTTQPAPVPAGAYRKIPTTIEDDALATFDPDADRLDFWESLEGMRVEIPGGKVTEPTRSYGTLVLTPDTAGPRSTAGGLLLTEYGPSPQRYLLARGLVDKLPEASVGTAVSGPIDAVVDYAFSNYQLLPVAPLVVTTPGVDCKATTALAAAPGKLTIAAWNVDNLSITGSADRVAKIGKALVERLGAPAIVALEEVEDDSGSDGKGDGVVTSAKTLQAIVDAARGAGGPAYQPIWIDPEPDKEGGIPGGNIRVALLVDPARVGFHRRGKAGPLDAAEPDGVGARLHLTLDPGRVDPRSAAFTMTSGEGVRRSLAVELEANGKPLFVVVNHWSSKWDDDKDFGANQPPRKPTDAKRLAQAAVVRAFVDRLLAADAKARVIVLGDLNDFPWSAPIRNLSAPPLVDLAAKIPDADRYSLNFEGSSQLIDDVVVSPSLADGAELAPVHFDADCPDKVRLSDHDPVVARLPVH